MWILEPFMVNWSESFKIYIITVIFFNTTLFCSAIFPLLGTLVFSILEASESLRNGLIPPKRLLGRQKLFGTLGMGLVTLLNGTLTDFIGYRAQFLIVFTSCLGFFAIAYFGLVAAPTRPVEIVTNAASPAIDPEAKKVVEKPSLARNARLLLANWEFIGLLVIVFLIGVCGSVFNVYFAVFMGKIIKTSTWENSKMGFMNSTRLFVEIPIYVWGDVLIRIFGLYGVLLMGMTASAIRPFGYSFVMKDESRALWGFVFELLKGFTHACNGLSGCVLASDMAPPGAQGTAQALFTSAHHHAASVISGILCTIYLTRRKIEYVPKLDQIIIYRDLFFWTGVIGCVGIILNLYIMVKSKRT